MKRANFSIIKVIFILAIIFLIILSVFSFVRTNNLIRSSEWVNHSTLVKLNLTNTLSSTLAMETGQRGFIISKDSTFLSSYKEESENLRLTFKKMDSLLNNNKLQYAHMIVLKEMVYKRVGYLENIMNESNSTSISKEKMMRGKILMDNIEQQIRLMTGEEDKLLQKRIDRLNREIFFSPLITTLLFLCATFFILIAYFKIMKDLRDSEQLKNEIQETNIILEQKNEELRKSEERYLKIFDFSPVAMTLAEIGNNQITYANENFYKTFGYSKEEIIGRTAEELNLVSPEENARLIQIILSYLDDDRPLEELQKLPPEETEQLLLKLRMKMFKDGFEVNYLRKNGENFYALVFFEIVEIGGKKVTISSYQDISEIKKATAQVEKQNEELTKMNKELESFNYISSHDLQEPLRKIQIFSNRIMETEKEKLSDQGQQYFNKIQNSAQRMQTLIRDLLSYSRINADEQPFIKTDLAKIVDQVVIELKDTIDEKQAVVEIRHLDTIAIIPFQFHQLIINLVSNALKFAREDVSPLISIGSRIEKGRNLAHESLKPESKYCHIKVQDNGIGFEQEYAERIFDVFRQLNVKGKFEGSGIGLSIVKKIVDNHNGYITASGEPDAGARFDIYIPV
jgi:signal transduction histidine kinase/CHASE3 domain sensor protein